jgi:hypothetical protein
MYPPRSRPPAPRINALVPATFRSVENALFNLHLLSISMSILIVVDACLREIGASRVGFFLRYCDHGRMDEVTAHVRGTKGVKTLTEARLWSLLGSINLPFHIRIPTYTRGVYRQEEVL